MSRSLSQRLTGAASLLAGSAPAGPGFAAAAPCGGTACGLRMQMRRPQTQHQVSWLRSTVQGTKEQEHAGLAQCKPESQDAHCESSLPGIGSLCTTSSSAPKLRYGAPMPALREGCGPGC